MKKQIIEEEEQKLTEGEAVVFWIVITALIAIFSFWVWCLS